MAAQRAAERALTLAPKGADGYLALGDYYAWCGTTRRARSTVHEGAALAPKDARLLAWPGGPSSS